MLECPNCDTPCKPEDYYCPQCGTRLPGGESAGGGMPTMKSLDLVEVYYTLGLIYFRKGEYEKALETWRMALERDPGNQALQARIAEMRTRLPEPH